MNLAEKILAGKVGRQAVVVGEFLNVPVDMVMTTDATGVISVQQFERMGAGKVFDPKKVVLVMDHFVPARNILAAENVKILRRFAEAQGTLWYGLGASGICHALLPEQGLVLPGDVVVGGDSHTTTYGAVGAFSTGMGSTDIAAAMALGEVWLRVPEAIKVNYHGRLPKWIGGKDLILYTIGRIGVEGANYCALEFSGEAAGELPMHGRFTMSNMAIEAGAKAGLFAADEKTLQYVRPRAKRPFNALEADPDADYKKVLDFDVSSLAPQVSRPHSPANAVPVGELAQVEIDQVVIGSCTNGWLGDLQVAAGLLSGRRVHPRLRCIVVPATQEVYLEALRLGLIETFVRAGAVVSTSSCGPCCGAHLGVIGEGERCVSTTNRNFIGRMGSTKSEVFLAGPAVAAASAVTGRISHPEEVTGR